VVRDLGMAQGLATRVVVVGDKPGAGEEVRSVRLDRRPKTLAVTGLHPDIRCGDSDGGAEGETARKGGSGRQEAA
jgi:hypothetical protein